MIEKKSLNYLSLALLNIAAIVSLRHFPAMALFGRQALMIYFVAALTFLIPLSLICAELASTWPERGGLYSWVLHAFGPRWAFLAVWWSWMAGITTIIANLTFFSVTFAQTFCPSCVGDQVLLSVFSLIALWSLTGLNLFGMRLSSWLSSLGVFVGTLLPIGGMLVLALIWFCAGKADGQEALITRSTWEVMQFFGLVVLSFSGMEIAAFHVADTQDPQQDYVKAVLITVVGMLFLYFFGTLALHCVIKEQEVHLVGGVVQFFQFFFDEFRLFSLGKMMNLVLLVGAVASVNTWIISPAKGIFAAVEDFNFPKWFGYQNKYQVPVHLIVMQAVLASVLILSMLNASVEKIFWMSTTLTAQFVMLFYFLVTFAFLKLRRIKPFVIRPYRVPSSWVVGVSGLVLLTLTSVFVIGFLPPEKIVSAVEWTEYVLSLICGMVLLSLPIMLFREKAVKTA